MERAMTVFHMARQTNLLSRFYDTIQKTFLGQFLYMIAPFVLYSINLMILSKREVLYRGDGQFGYLNDIGNSLGLTMLFFVSYFLSGSFPQKLKEFIINGTEEEMRDTYSRYEAREHVKTVLWAFRVVLFVMILAATLCFCHIIQMNHAYWMKKLTIFGVLYYCFILGVTWYFSLTVFGMTVCAGLLIFYAIRSNQMVYREEDYNRNISVIKAFDVLACTIAHGSIYILDCVIIILNDRIAVSYGIHYLFRSDIKTMIFAQITICLTILEFIPLKELFAFMRKKKDEMIIRLNRQMEEEAGEENRKSLMKKRDSILAEKLVVTTAGNKIMIVLSVAIPLAGILLQGVALYVK